MTILNQLAKATLIGVAGLTVVSGVVFYKTSVRKADFVGGDKAALRCACGKFKGEVALPKNESQIAGFHVSCHCEDCRLWAGRVVKKGGLDAEGGDDILFVHMATVKVLTPELLKGYRLYEKSHLHRYMTSCCETSIGSCMSNSPICAISSSIIPDQSQRELLLSRLYPEKMIIKLKERKQEEQFKTNPDAAANFYPKLFRRFFGLIVTGLLEMKEPSAFPEDASKEIVLFPKGYPRDETAA